jgi:hypothetical protein
MGPRFTKRLGGKFALKINGMNRGKELLNLSETVPCWSNISCTDPGEDILENCKEVIRKCDLPARVPATLSSKMHPIIVAAIFLAAAFTFRMKHL